VLIHEITPCRSPELHRARSRFTRLPGCVLATLLGVLSFAGLADARGIYYEPAPWYSSAFYDTLLSLEAGVTYAEADTHDTVLFPLALSTVQRGPVQFAGRWSYISMRGDSGHRTDFADLKVYARYRIPVFQDSTDARRPSLWVESSARIGLSRPEMFPFATGGQELELLGVFGWPRLANAILGAGRIWSEPPSGSALKSIDVPHATHVFLQARAVRGTYDFQARGDAYIYEVKGERRGVFSAAVTRRSAYGFHMTLEYSLESSAGGERIFNHLLALRFATRLR